MSYSCSFSFQLPKALPAFHSSPCGTRSLFTASNLKPSHTITPSQSTLARSSTQKLNGSICLNKPSLALQIGSLMALVEQPALAVTGENNVPDLTGVLIPLGIVAFGYFIVVPPIIMNWLRTRWYKRGLLEMYVQFMFVFLFFPGILVWAPFLNFRKFPRDPDMKYPWSPPGDPTKIKSGYFKYPYAEPEDYS